MASSSHVKPPPPPLPVFVYGAAPLQWDDDMSVRLIGMATDGDTPDLSSVADDLFVVVRIVGGAADASRPLPGATGHVVLTMGNASDLIGASPPDVDRVSFQLSGGRLVITSHAIAGASTNAHRLIAAKIEAVTRRLAAMRMLSEMRALKVRLHQQSLEATVGSLLGVDLQPCTAPIRRMRFTGQVPDIDHRLLAPVGVEVTSDPSLADVTVEFINAPGALEWQRNALSGAHARHLVVVLPDGTGSFHGNFNRAVVIGLR